MPALKKGKKIKKDKPPASSTSQVDLIFSGPLLFVPEVENGNVTSVEVYSPNNGHPVGAVFLPGTIFSNEDLDDPEGEKWPDARSLSLLDPHSYSIHLLQHKPQQPFPLASIPATNHKVKPGRRLSGEWEIAIKIYGQLSGWSSHRVMQIKDNMYYGSDAPKGITVAITQRLSYAAVSNAEVHGVSPEQTAYLDANIRKGGTLIVEGEVPYQSSLQHERLAIDALARLAGLNLHLTTSAPIAGRSRLQSHIFPCTNSIIVASTDGDQ